MKSTIYFFISIMFLFSSCKGQNKNLKKNETTEVTTEKSTSGMPKMDVKVNKIYDKKGNLISYDSTYSSYYSSRKNDKLLMDSLLNEFKPKFDKQFPLMNDIYFKNLFYSDSLIYNDFFHEDFFRKRFELNEAYMNELMKQMDSVKNTFFKMHSSKLKTQ